MVINKGFYMAGKGSGKYFTGGAGNGPLPNINKMCGTTPNTTSGHPVKGKGTVLKLG